MLEKLTRPLVKAAERFVPPDKIAEAIDNAYESSELQSHRVRIAQKAGVSHVHELRHVDLQVCCDLADSVSWESAEKAMFWGAAAGGGNLVNVLIGLNTLLTNCLKTIHTIGYCYGFGTEESHERDYVLGVLLVSCASSLHDKQRADVTLGHMEDLIFEEAFSDLLEDAIAEKIIHSAGLSTIPVLGMMTGAMHSASLTEHTAMVAKFCFMERWLRHRRNIDRTPANPNYARTLTSRMRSAVGNEVYWGAFGTSFLVCVPFAWLASFLPRGNPVMQGIADGSHDATADALRILKNVTAAQEPGHLLRGPLEAAFA